MAANIRILTDPPQCIPAVVGETLPTSALQVGVAFPHDCQSGIAAPASAS